MANPDHLEILKQGSSAWNQWRKKHPRKRPSLRNANLQGLSFEVLTYGGVDLSGADLRGVNLNLADLIAANFSDADLTGASLDSSKCIDANFQNSILKEVNLAGANLTFANLRGADLTAAYFATTVLGDCDLTNARGLDSCEFLGRSIIDLHTLSKSGMLPTAFLRGCGLSDTIIDYLPSLIGQPIQFYACFISYSFQDQKFANRLYSDLQSWGVRCWLATEDLKIGAKMRPAIDEAIRLHDKLLLVLSKHSVASDWVEQEVETALERERREKRLILFPIRLDNAVMDAQGGWPQLIRNTRNIGDFRRLKSHDSYQTAFERLLRDLKAET